MASTLGHFCYISFAQELYRNAITLESLSENPPVRVNGVKNGRVRGVSECDGNKLPVLRVEARQIAVIGKLSKGAAVLSRVIVTRSHRWGFH